MTDEKKQLTENEITMLLHIDTLTTAIEDAMDILEFDRIAPVDLERARRILSSALNEVWEDGDESESAK